ncbi:hypothetical protein Bca101_058570 [Brassica carinata]
MVRVQRYLPIGQWKVIDTFKIGGAGGQYRPTKQQYKMTILTNTMISRSDYLNDSEFLDLASYEEIGNGTCKPNFLIDVMGQVTDLAAVATVQVKGIDTKRVNFRLRDERVENSPLPLALFDQKNEKKIMTKVRDDWDVVDVRCISELLLSVELHLTVRDDTETCKIMLLDIIAMTIIGCKATELWDGSFAEIEDPELLPMPIQDLVGKSFCFGVKVTTENFSNGSDIFKVSEVWSGDYIQRIESLSEPLSLNETISSTMSGGEISIFNENSSDGFATPNVKRKEDDLDQQEMTSTSKKLCRTIVKKEKIVK